VLISAGLEHRPLYQFRHTYAPSPSRLALISTGSARSWGTANIRTTLKFYARFQPVVDGRNLVLLDAFRDSAPSGVSETGHMPG
jgi:hypothetical protein